VIDFRYHLVSLVAVFMALATGILVGTSLLNQSLIDSQRSTIASFAGEKDALRHDLAAAQSQVAYRDDYLSSLRDTLLTGRLTGHRVVLVLLPGAARKDADSLTRTLQDAGAVVAGRIDVNAAFFDTTAQPDGGGKAMLRDQTVRSYALADVKGRSPEAQLAGALVSRTPRALEPAAVSLVSELDRDGLIGREQLIDRGDLAVLVAGNPPSKPQPVDERVTAGSVRLAAALEAAADGTVVAGPSAAAVGGPLQAVREDGTVSSVVSTVDGTETPFGQVAVAYALVEQLAGGSGQYGAADSSDAPLPQFRVPAARK
jgi:Copper transport outer membrane protein, MctB